MKEEIFKKIVGELVKEQKEVIGRFSGNYYHRVVEMKDVRATLKKVLKGYKIAKIT